MTAESADRIRMSVIVIVSRGREFITRLLNSIAPFLNDKIEIVIVSNGGGQGSLGSADRPPHGNIKYIELSQTSIGSARNEAIRQSRGEILYFLDDDVIVGHDIFRIALDGFNARLDIGVIGGPNLTPPGSGFFQKCSGMVLASVFGSAHARFRYKKARKQMPADDSSLIACNLAIRRSALDNTGLFFNETVIRNEENLLLEALGAMGIRMLYVPELFIYHERRKSAAELFLQIFHYGYGRAQQARRAPRTTSLLNLLPSALIIYILSVLICPNSRLYYYPLLIYVASGTIFSFGLGISARNFAHGFCALWLFPFVHMAYGLGFIRGIAPKPWIR